MRSARHWRVANDIEITLEANPTSVEAGKLKGFRAAGINRVSMGIQALDDADLKFLGRQHNQGEALAALGLAADTFDRFTFDLIYARPVRHRRAGSRSLTRALDFAADHISLYQLTIETGTVFEQAYARGDFVLPDEDVQAELFELTQARPGRCGPARAYEISNHARPGSESRHNLTYWRYGDYVGIGPGAHGRLTLMATSSRRRQHRAPERWLEMVAEQGHATRQYDEVGADARISELDHDGAYASPKGYRSPGFEAETRQALCRLPRSGARERAWSRVAFWKSAMHGSTPRRWPPALGCRAGRVVGVGRSARHDPPARTMTMKYRKL